MPFPSPSDSAPVYLDNAATTAVHPRVAEAVLAAMLEGFGNPSSRHRLGARAREAVEQARRGVAALIGADPEEIVFTGGGTEANNAAVFGAARARAHRGRHAVVSAVEHPSVLEPAKALAREGFQVTLVPPGADGVVAADRFLDALTPETVFVSLMMVNNEVGAMMPVAEVAAATRSRSPHAVVHCDLVQAAGRLPVDVHRLDVDLASLSAHKLHGPKGVGALYVRKDVGLQPLLLGGGQERGMRSGTENVPGIVGFGVAARLALDELPATPPRLRRLCELLWEGLREAYPRARRLGPSDPQRQAPHILPVAFEGLRAEVVANHLDEAGVMASVGSACSSHHQRVSHVLRAMDVPQRLAESAVRFSLGLLTTEEDIARAVRRIRPILAELAAFASGEPARRGR